MPLFVLRQWKTGENARDKIKRRNNAQNPDDAYKKFDAVRQRELKIADDESSDAAKKKHFLPVKEFYCIRKYSENKLQSRFFIFTIV